MSEYVSHYLELKPAGIGALGLCLFHDDQRPSFGVSDEGNEGTVSHVAAKVPFWVKLRGCDSTAAITKLAEMLLS